VQYEMSLGLETLLVVVVVGVVVIVDYSCGCCDGGELVILVNFNSAVSIINVYIH